MPASDDALKRLIRAIGAQRDAIAAGDWPLREAAADEAQLALTDLVADGVPDSMAGELAVAKELLDTAIAETRTRLEVHAMQLQALAQRLQRSQAAKLLDRHG